MNQHVGPKPGKREHRRLTEEETYRLLTEHENGDPTASQRIVDGHMGLIVSIATECFDGQTPLEDLVAAAVETMIKSIVPNYDKNNGTRFGTYANIALRRGIIKANIGEDNRYGYRVGVKATSLRHMIAAVRNNFYARNGRCPEPHEILTDLHAYPYKTAQDVTLERLERILGRPLHQKISLDQPISAEIPDPLVEGLMSNTSLNPELAAIVEDTRRFWTERLRAMAPELLNERERAIVIGYYGLAGKPKRTLENIGEKYNLSRERVRQIRDDALRTLAINVRLRYDEDCDTNSLGAILSALGEFKTPILPE